MISEEVVDIQWDTNYLYDNSKIILEFSSDNGIDWFVLENDITNKGRFQWYIPKFKNPSDDCLFRLSDHLYTENYFYSDTFNVVPKPSLTLKINNFKKEYYQDDILEISWLKQNDSKHNVNIEFSKNNGLSWEKLISSNEKNHTYHWKIPKLNQNFEKCLIKSSLNGIDNISTVSKNFLIRKELPVKVLSPSKNDLIRSESGTYINWEYNDNKISNFDIMYSLDNGMTWTYLSNVNVISGFFIWKVPLM